MTTYQAPVDEYRFIFKHILKLDQIAGIAPLADLSLDDIGMILQGAAEVCQSALAPVNAAGDIEGSRLGKDGALTASGFPAAYRALQEGGWIGLQASSEPGNPGLPNVVAKAVHEFRASASMAVAGFAELTEAVYLAIEAFGDETQKRIYLAALAEGRFAGTMHLTEPQAGSDIGLIRTRATPHADGSYRLNGSKIFISDAEQDLTENVVNLVLARIDGAPSGTRGLSLFLVPRLLPDAEGRPGERNRLGYVSLEHKMGLHGSVTGTMVYEDAVGFLLGAANGGLAPLFTMVNETRLGVGLQGLAIAATACQAALSYARERLQGRVPGQAQGPQPIIRHADVKRMLLAMKGFVEGGRVLAAWTALQMDIARHCRAEGERLSAAATVNLLTPLVKAFFTDEGFAVADMALQIHGGHGYMRDTGVEQLLRDVRVTRIYEGANGIIAYDLAQRKVCADGGKAMNDLIARIRTDLEGSENKASEALEGPLRLAFDDFAVVTGHLLRLGSGFPPLVGAVACDYLRFFGLCMLGWSWLRIARAVPHAIEAGDIDPAEGRSKMLTAEFFMRWQLCETATLRQRILLDPADFDFLDAIG